ncbi:hypothetical protein CTEN210_04105 [Chaetoceros tenuissimus]|uniref:Uncharacterized protein n=1 Tax=Chaetoceros tenuissimus TaxID=426638 RepID=A0AAD3H268_9STRA|nr:hypothetical protein CTEN210_04105 [Chaetoceros tenuissimus]
MRSPLFLQNVPFSFAFDGFASLSANEPLNIKGVLKNKYQNKMSTSKRLKVSHSSDRGRGEEELSASISDLPNDLLKHCFSFIPGSYITIAPVSRQFHRNYSTMDMDDSLTALSTDSLLKIGRNRRTTADAVSYDIKLTEYCFVIFAPRDFMIKVCKKAASKGRTDILECAKIFGVDLFEVVRKEVIMHSNLMNSLAEEGNLRMIQYIDSKLPDGINEYSSSDEYIWLQLFSTAAVSNQLHIMKWICAEKCQDADKKRNMKSRIEAHEVVLEGEEASEATEALCINAAMHGNIQVLEYCHRNNYQFDSHFSKLCHYSMENKDKEQALETLKWLRRHGCTWDVRFCNAAAHNNNLEALKWARSENCPWDETTLSEAAKRGNIDIIEYCLQNRCPMTVHVCTAAMVNLDHSAAFEVLKLLRKYSCPWDVMTLRQAICFCHFEGMFFMIKNGCTLTIDSFALLTQRGNVAIIEEVLQDEEHHGLLFVQTEGKVKMHPEVVESIDRSIFRRANEDYIIEKLKLLSRYGYEWNAETIFQARRGGQYRVVQWLEYMGCPMDGDLV